MRPWAALALALLLLPPPALGQAAAGPSTPWWPPGPAGTDIGKGFHLRVPVTVRNDLPYAVSNGAVAAEVDLAAGLAQAGWTTAPSGDLDLLKGFHLDPNSVRVVAMTEGWQLKAADTTVANPADPRRYEVPSTHVEGSLAGSERAFDAFVNPLITVFWRVAGTLDPGARANFMVYLDTDLTNPKKTAASYDTLAGGDLESLFWSGPGLTLYGYVRPPSGQAGTVEVIGLHPNTRVEVYSGTPGQQMGPLAVSSGSNAFTLGAHESRTIAVSAGVPAAVKLVADRPIVAQGTSTGFIPSIDGGMTGKQFVFSFRHPREREQDTIYFTKTGPAETRILVEPIGDTFGPTRLFVLAADRPYPYTVGGREGIADGCFFSNAPSPVFRPAGPGTYRATVLQGGERVLAQLLPTDGLFQVPTSRGHPEGKEFWASTDWTDDQFASGSCARRTRQGDWLASATGTAATVTVRSPEAAAQVDPRGDPEGIAFPPGRSVASGASLAGPFPAAMPDRPLQFEASNPIRLFAGLDPMQVGTSGQGYPLTSPTFSASALPSVHGPLGGGGAGRRFTVPGASLVFAPFDDTVVTADSAYLRSTGRTTVAMSADSSYLLQDRPQSDLLEASALRASRPVVVYPLSATGGFFAGVPPFLTATVGAAEYRGYLVGLSSPTGLDPVVGSGVPGLPASYPLTVRNLGRAAGGGNLPDNVALSVDGSSLPTGWKASIDLPSTGTIPSGASQEFTLTVTAPAGAQPGQQGIVTVRATSTGNPLVQDSLQVVTFLKQSFAVGIWFEVEDGPKERIASAANGVATFPLVVKNEGSVPDVIDLSLVAFDTEWTTSLEQAGKPVDSVSLEPQKTARLTLLARPPARLKEGTLDVDVIASSASAPSIKDGVHATAELRPPADLRLDANETVRFVAPGQNATFNLTLRNPPGSTPVTLSARGGGTAGWSVPRLLVAGEAPKGNRTSIGNESTPVQVTVRAPADAPAGSTVTLRFGARPDIGRAVEAILFAKVRAVHDLGVTLPGVPVNLARLAENHTVEMRVRNAGNLDELLNLSAAELPSGWALGAPPEVLVPRNATQAVAVNLTAPAGTPPGLYNVTLRLRAADGNETRVAMPVLVGAVPGQRVAGPAGQPVQPGQRARVEVPLSNEGNTPLRVTVTPAPGDPWRLEPIQELLLRPGERTVLTLSWLVPANAANGASAHTATLRLDPGLGLEARSEAITGRFDVARAELSVTSVDAVPAPGGTLVRATVANRGLRPALGFTVDLVVDGAVADRVPVGELPSNGTVEVAFLQAQPGAARIVADGNATVAEGNEGDNAAAVPAAGGRDAPALGLPLAAALALAGALLRRQRSARP